MANKSGIPDEEWANVKREAQEFKIEWIRKKVITLTNAGAEIDEAYIMAWEAFKEKFDAEDD